MSLVPARESNNVDTMQMEASVQPSTAMLTSVPERKRMMRFGRIRGTTQTSATLSCQFDCEELGRPPAHSQACSTSLALTPCLPGVSRSSSHSFKENIQASAETSSNSSATAWGAPIYCARRVRQTRLAAKPTRDPSTPNDKTKPIADKDAMQECSES